MIRLKAKDFKIGWGEVVIIIVLIGFAIWGYLQKMELDAHALYTKGVVIGTSKGAKGSMYVDFYFFADGEKITSWTPLFKGWRIGDTILIKYSSENPRANKVIKEIPPGEIIR